MMVIKVGICTFKRVIPRPIKVILSLQIYYIPYKRIKYPTRNIISYITCDNYSDKGPILGKIHIILLENVTEEKIETINNYKSSYNFGITENPINNT